MRPKLQPDTTPIGRIRLPGRAHPASELTKRLLEHRISNIGELLAAVSEHGFRGLAGRLNPRAGADEVSALADELAALTIALNVVERDRRRPSGWHRDGTVLALLSALVALAAVAFWRLEFGVETAYAVQRLEAFEIIDGAAVEPRVRWVAWWDGIPPSSLVGRVALEPLEMGMPVRSEHVTDFSLAGYGDPPRIVALSMSASTLPHLQPGAVYGFVWWPDDGEGQVEFDACVLQAEGDAPTALVALAAPEGIEPSAVAGPGTATAILGRKRVC